MFLTITADYRQFIVEMMMINDEDDMADTLKKNCGIQRKKFVVDTTLDFMCLLNGGNARCATGSGTSRKLLVWRFYWQLTTDVNTTGRWSWDSSIQRARFCTDHRSGETDIPSPNVSRVIIMKLADKGDADFMSFNNRSP